MQALEVERDLLLARAKQDMRREILPFEQAPQIVEAASKVLHGTNLSIYGEGTELMGQLGPVFELLTRAVQQATQGMIKPVGPDAVESTAEGEAAVPA